MVYVNKYIDKYEKLSIQAKASLWFMICSVLQKGITTLTTPIFTRLLSTTEYGVFNVFISWEGIVSAITILTLPWGVFEQGLIKYSEKRKEFTSSTLGLMTFLLFIWTGIYLIFHNIINNLVTLTTPQMLLMLAFVWTNSVFVFWSITQRVEYNYKKLVALTIAVSILKPLIGIILVLMSDDKVTARIAGMVAVEFIAYIGLFISMLRNGKRFYDKDTWLYALKFNIPLIPHYLSQRILNSADRIMIRRMISASASGIYSLAYSLSMLLGFVNTAIQNAFNPWIYQKIKDNKAQDISRVAYLLLCAVAVINLMLIIFAPEIISIFATKEYYEAIWVIPPVTMSVYFQFMYGFFANVEFYFEKTGLMSFATMVGAVLNLILNAIFIPIFGFVAAGYTTLACYVLYCILHYIFMTKVCNDYLGMSIFRPSIILVISSVFIIISFVISFTYNNWILRYSLLLGLLLLVSFNKKKLFEIYSIIKK